MTDQSNTWSNPSATRRALALGLAQVVVPLWLLAGAVLKILDASPSHLPVPIIKGAGAVGLELGFILHFTIAVELIVAGVMWLLPRLSRPVGIVMLAGFLPVLAAEVAMGASSCGCFGAVEIHPGVTLTMDLGFLLGLWWLGRGVEPLATTAAQPTWRVLAAGLWILISVGLAFGLVTAAPVTQVESDAVSASAGPVDGYYLPTYDQWIGRPWEEVPIAAWIQGASSELSEGTRFVLFYRKDCEHCHELMEAFFTGPLAVPTTAVAVPDRGGFPTVGTLSFPCDQCDRAELPSGVDWFLQTPVLVRLADGIVECAAEVTADKPECLAWKRVGMLPRLRFLAIDGA